MDRELTREEKRIYDGIMFSPGDPELVALKLKAHNLSTDYSMTHEDEYEKRKAILQELIGELGENVRVQGPIFFHYGCHTKLDDGVFINYGFTCQDDAQVTIGKGVAFGPNCTIVTPLHPMILEERRGGIKDPDGNFKACWAKPVTIGNYCWIGANVVICPGVTIGEGCVIGANAVVTKDIPPRTFAAGNPCRVIREITEADTMKNHPEILGDCTVTV
ncbi:MAG: sugar O-acetyltransferase [Lachnospiraceae bacterium]|nr:sugar O-acetyltransferase [Lachnospiraceae bacterium]